ncbi:MAG TPA: serine hydrolase [Noviherbaspirillum sp.]
MLAAACVHAQGAPDPQNPAASDPNLMGWMQGFPPAADKMVRFGDASFLQFPRTRWSFSHMRELLPTANVWRGDATTHRFASASLDIGALQFTDDKGETITWDDMLARSYTDAILVLHEGKIVYERYFGAGHPQLPHISFSVTKSMVGTLAATLAHEGVIDAAAPVTRYIPELKDTAYGDATVRQVMDMTIGVKYSEDYADPKSDIWSYARAGGMLPSPPGYAGPKTLHAFLLGVKKEGNHGEAFAYKTINTDVLGWILKRATGRSVATLLSERIWQKLGMENDSYFLVDTAGSEFGGGGLNLTLRDMARFGEMMRLDGRFNEQQVIPKAVVDDIRRGGDRVKFAKAAYPDAPGYAAYSYRSMWWVSHEGNRAYDARGIHGQRIYIDPVARMVVVKLSSHPVASNLQHLPLTDRAYRALADHLTRK